MKRCQDGAEDTGQSVWRSHWHIHFQGDFSASLPQQCTCRAALSEDDRLGVFEELKRRNVFRVAVAYTIGAWLIAQIADIVLNNIGAPDWVIQALFLLLAIGFAAALII